MVIGRDIIKMRESVVRRQKKKISVLKRVVCCRCFDSQKDEVNVTSNARKQTLQRMIRNYVIHDEEDTLYDPTKLMILIHLCGDPAVSQKFISKCRINPILNQTYRTDLLFYVPQLCNYVVYHQELKGGLLSDSIQRCCQSSFYFAQAYYFYMSSLQRNITPTQIEELQFVKAHLAHYLEEMKRCYQRESFCAAEHYLRQTMPTNALTKDTAYMLKSYGASQQQALFSRPVSVSDIALLPYSSFAAAEDEEKHPFTSTLLFFADLFSVVEQIQSVKHEGKDRLKQLLQKINLQLPACVYVPFFREGMHLKNVLNVVTSEAKIFSTKERAPVYLCLEVYDPVEAYSFDLQKKYWKAVAEPITLKRLSFKSADSFREDVKEPELRKEQTEIFHEKEGTFLKNKLLEMSNEMETQPRLQVQMKSLSRLEIMKKLENIFGEKEEEVISRIKYSSIFGQLETWRLLHIIVKTNDNLKQEQFALQLITQFDTIFRLSGLNLHLTPYEVLTMGPQEGILEMVRETVTFDRLKRHLKTNFTPSLSLSDFFELFYGGNLPAAKDIFLRSLVGYSLVMYLLQCKDRHNGNILLHRSGKILHIDFGFLLSNMPGKGVELERDCPFKLLTEHIQVLDGQNSVYFKKFRELFFQGFRAARKHQNKILMLVKMMYSASGAMMPCFQKGEEAIAALEQRFNPPEVRTDAQLNLHCQQLINASLDNWATKWYDRFQYFAQGIFY